RSLNMKTKTCAMFAISMLISAYANAGAISSGTPPTRVEADCASSDGKTTVFISQSLFPDSPLVADLTSPEGNLPQVEVQKTPDKPTYEGKYEGNGLTLSIYFTAQPVPVSGPYERAAHLSAVVGGVAVESEVDCTLFAH